MSEHEKTPRWRILTLMAGPAGFARSKTKTNLLFCATLQRSWLGQIKQALTIYKEDIRNKLDNFNPEG